MSDIGPGDVVIKKRGCCTIIPRGKVLRVYDICPVEHGGAPGLIFREYRDPEACVCFSPINFDKLRPSTESVADMIARCQPIPQREKERV